MVAAALGCPREIRSRGGGRTSPLQPPLDGRAQQRWRCTYADDASREAHARPRASGRPCAARPPTSAAHGRGAEACARHAPHSSRRSDAARENEIAGFEQDAQMGRQGDHPHQRMARRVSADQQIARALSRGEHIAASDQHANRCRTHECRPARDRRSSRCRSRAAASATRPCQSSIRASVASPRARSTPTRLPATIAARHNDSAAVSCAASVRPPPARPAQPPTIDSSLATCAWVAASANIASASSGRPRSSSKTPERDQGCGGRHECAPAKQCAGHITQQPVGGRVPPRLTELRPACPRGPPA